MEVSKIHPIFKLKWLQLAIDSGRMYALVPRDQVNNAESHGYICETPGGGWKCAGLDATGQIVELPSHLTEYAARKAVERRVTETVIELATCKLTEEVEDAR